MTDFLTRQGASNPATTTFQVLGVGLGTTPPGGGGLHVGATGLLRIDATGNLVRVNDVPYSWPVAQGAAGQMLTNDGAGNLTWTTPAGGLSGSGAASRVAYWSGASALASNANFAWDNGAGRLGVGNAAPISTFDVTGHVSVTNTGTASEVRLYEPSGSGSNYSAFKAQAQTGDVTYTLPADAGTNGYVLTTNGSGTLTWAAAASGANTALSNLAAVAVNTHINPGVDNTVNIGTTALRFGTVTANQFVSYNFGDTLTLVPSSLTTDVAFTVNAGGAVQLLAPATSSIELRSLTGGEVLLASERLTLFDNDAADLTIHTSRRTGGAAGLNLAIIGNGATGAGTDLAGGNITITTGISTGSGGSDFFVQTATPAVSGTTDNLPDTKFTVRGNGEVAFGSGLSSAVFDPSQPAIMVGTADPAVIAQPIVTISPLYISALDTGGGSPAPFTVYANTLNLNADGVGAQVSVDIGGTANSFVFTGDRALQFSGSSAAVSPGATGRIRYDGGTNKLQFSNNGGAYADIGAVAIGSTVASGTTGSVLFVGAASALSQDNANFFWDDTNNQLLLGSGTVSLPSYSYAGDPDTGAWHPVTANTLAFSNNGTETMRLTATNTVAIGTSTTTASTLNVQGNATAAATFIGELNKRPSLFLKSYDTTVAYYPAVGMYFGAGSLASPGTTATGTTLGLLDFGGYRTAGGAETSGAQLYASATEAWGPSASGTKLTFRTTTTGTTGVTDRVTLDHNGNFGIGATSPTAQLHIDGVPGTSNYHMYWLGALGASGTQTNGIRHQLTTAGSGSSASRVGYQLLLSGSAASTGGTIFMSGGNFDVNVTGVDSNDLRISNATATPLGGSGFHAASRGTSTGLNVGGSFAAEAGVLNVAALVRATTLKNSATNIGVLSAALNTGTSPINVAGYFGLQNTTPTLTSAALMADNGATTNPIFVCRDNGSAVWTVSDGGNMTMNGNFDLVPGTDDQGEIGTDALRWNRVRATNVVTGDLDLKDESKNAHWKFIEEHDSITVVNMITGKRFKMALTPIED